MSDRRNDVQRRTESVGIDALVDAARAVRLNAHAPYSRFLVGAAVLASDGAREQVFTGCNVENAAFGSTMCAERNALAAAVAAGFREMRDIVVYTEATVPTTPCGACRQVMQELAPGARVHLASPSGVHAALRVGELFPHPFGPASLDSD